MAYADLRDFIRALEKNQELKRIPFEVDPHPRDHRVRRPRGENRRPRAAVRKAQRLCDIPVLINASPACARMQIALEVDSVDEVAARIAEFLEMRCPKGLMGKLKMLPKLAEMGSFFPKIVSEGAVPGSGRRHRTFRCSITRC